MAKRPIKGNGNSKIRLIVLEAEGPEGELSQIASAIKDALRPSQVAQPRVAKPQGQVIEQHADTDGEFEAPEFEDADYVEETSAPTAPKPRKPAKRVVVHMDLDSPVSLAEFATKYPIKNDKDRFLVALAFLKEHRPDISPINADHLFTCFKSMDWPSGARDFSQPLRNLKAEHFVDAGEERGTYVINHVGEGKLKKLLEG
ncbi:hypothetical protein [uncultured Tateyamaria sp.]|uniref:hypothetical protein n=1 Tax=uncultured Tateyamaria sp. TaxID=455651 RepID=UPI00261E8D36|nr:hypothetical protein [uncultured Tateyamaria sp.]